MPVFLFNAITSGNRGEYRPYDNWNKYNPKYTFRSMKQDTKTAKLEPRGNMMNSMNEDIKNQKDWGSAGELGVLFEIRVKGHLDESWSDWLEGMEVKLEDNGEMILHGRIGDQAALLGILIKLNDLNLTLLSLSEVNRPK